VQPLPIIGNLHEGCPGPHRQHSRRPHRTDSQPRARPWRRLPPLLLFRDLHPLAARLLLALDRPVCAEPRQWAQQHSLRRGCYWANPAQHNALVIAAHQKLAKQMTKRREWQRRVARDRLKRLVQCCWQNHCDALQQVAGRLLMMAAPAEAMALHPKVFVRTLVEGPQHRTRMILLPYCEAHLLTIVVWPKTDSAGFHHHQGGRVAIADGRAPRQCLQHLVESVP